ncbi:3-oxoacyl-[acyl-carrier-protein] reductase FabG [mine drainage metagenome]|uniref:3-oxoacyl-[acyl-carrier-protein] reductase FabG n=1 Tax=mine drainage metagenome TaxID=410659 RepID=A0A1J5R1E7_9ZZZZ
MSGAGGSRRLLLFGASGSIGGAVSELFRRQGWQIIAVTRGNPIPETGLHWDPLDEADLAGRKGLAAFAPFDAVCWAQGQNCNDSVYDFNIAAHNDMYRANVLYVLASMHHLVRAGHLAKPARLCLISSIWQNIARQNKLSYSVTKSALHGLVLSAANDLGRDGHLVNAVLPGALDTPMTRSNLAPEQLEKMTDSTQFGRLPTLQDVASIVHYLCSEANTGLTGQFIKADLGFSDVRII